jgi:zinc-binding alcohol dehydrogenase family protein
MRAIGYSKSLPVSDLASLEDIEVPDYTASDLGPHDLLVEISAISVNPVDTKVRMHMAPESGHKILGWDASGTVRAVGSEVTLFEPGDAVFHAGALGRPGTNSELHIVDGRIAGPKPASLNHAEAAALPLTSITAWELLFDGMGIKEGQGENDALLVIGGAGGVGSILIQLAKALTGLTVIATASREETRDWCLRMGADHIVGHRRGLKDQLDQLGIQPRYVASLTATDKHFDEIVDLIAPRGTIAVVDDPPELDALKLKPKALTLHFEFMFARPMHAAADLIEQHRLLGRVSQLVDRGAIVTTANWQGGGICAANLREAHARQESGRAIGKTVFAGFP